MNVTSKLYGHMRHEILNETKRMDTSIALLFFRMMPMSLARRSLSCVVIMRSTVR